MDSKFFYTLYVRLVCFFLLYFFIAFYAVYYCFYPVLHVRQLRAVFNKYSDTQIYILFAQVQ